MYFNFPSIFPNSIRKMTTLRAIAHEVRGPVTIYKQLPHHEILILPSLSLSHHTPLRNYFIKYIYTVYSI